MRRKIYTGEVISDKMDKTVVVAVKRLVQDSTYKKTIKKITKFKAHDEENKCKVGDKVEIIETRPISKEKRWVVLKILKSEGSSIGQVKP
ncbi:MAG: 30S ribosomal protein S17 [Nitrospirae bacterium]|nr:30S ribosomal protein S17 [Nitrospirota bacterium]